MRNFMSIDTSTQESQIGTSFTECIKLLDECCAAGIIQRDLHNKNNIIVYRKAGEYSRAGWYSENLMSVATELHKDIEGQLFLSAALEEKKASSGNQSFLRRKLEKSQAKRREADCR